MEYMNRQSGKQKPTLAWTMHSVYVSDYLKKTLTLKIGLNIKIFVGKDNF